MFTTARYAHAATCNLARALATACGTTYVGRGKKTIRQLVAEARREGGQRIIILEESNGKPSRLTALAVDEKGRWKRAGSGEIEDAE